MNEKIIQKQETEPTLAILRGELIRMERGKDHWGHRGRKGQRGGSMPKGAKGVGVMKRADVITAFNHYGINPPSAFNTAFPNWKLLSEEQVHEIAKKHNKFYREYFNRSYPKLDFFNDVKKEMNL